MNEAEFQRNLTRFKAILKREKRYLIKNDGEKVTETVSQKEKFIPIFENYDGPVSDKTKACQVYLAHWARPRAASLPIRLPFRQLHIILRTRIRMAIQDNVST